MSDRTFMKTEATKSREEATLFTEGETLLEVANDNEQIVICSSEFTFAWDKSRG
jgi:hypothetical protein